MFLSIPTIPPERGAPESIEAISSATSPDWPIAPFYIPFLSLHGQQRAFLFPPTIISYSVT